MHELYDSSSKTQTFHLYQEDIIGHANKKGFPETAFKNPPLRSQALQIVFALTLKIIAVLISIWQNSHYCH